MRVLLLLALVAIAAAQSIQEPYPWLFGGDFTGEPAPLSPDPLVQYQWGPHTPYGLQVYNVTPAAVWTENQGSFRGLNTLIDSPFDAAVEVLAAGAFRVDFGTESAAWLEIESPDMPASAYADLQLSISETSEPFKFQPSGMLDKIQQPVRHGNVYRLEIPSNKELYEGVRFGFVFVRSSPPDVVWHITSVRAVAQILPVNYSGAFHAPTRPLLERVWYSAAYCPKLNMLPSYLGAILMDRGDRIGWTGDDHVAQSTIMAAFGQYAFVNMSLWNTHADSNNIESYALYWTLSVAEYFDITGDARVLSLYSSNIAGKLDHAISVQGQAHLTFFGWDERLGAGFENASCVESQRAFTMLTIRACLTFARVINATDPTLAAKYQTAALSLMAAARRAGPTWYTAYGLHAAADAVNTGLLTLDEKRALFALRFNNSAQICSLSAFNTYFILQALGHMGRYDHALAVVELCWGGMNALGGTSYWEVFTFEWQAALSVSAPVFNFQNGWTSLCHPWASGALQWLSYVGLGVTPLAPAFRAARIQPALAVVDGKMPTPHGAITVSQRASEGRLNVTLPPGVTAVLSVMLLADVSSVRLVTLNGEALQASAWTLTKHEDRTWLTLAAAVGSGAHVLLVSAAHDLHAAQSPRGEESVMKTVTFPGGNTLKLPLGPYSPPTYAASLVGEDRVTRGNWQGRYGKQGYALFAASAGRDVLALPAFVASIGHVSSIAFNPVDAGDERALQLPSGGRGLGSGLGGGIQFVNYVDVLVQQSAENKPYLLSAYFCDFDCPTCPHPTAEVGQARSMGVVAYDFYTRETIAPVTLLANFSQGVWLTWRVSASLRLRFPQVSGDNPVLSALMFDAV